MYFCIQLRITSINMANMCLVCFFLSRDASIFFLIWRVTFISAFSLKCNWVNQLLMLPVTDILQNGNLQQPSRTLCYIWIRPWLRFPWWSGVSPCAKTFQPSPEVGYILYRKELISLSYGNSIKTMEKEIETDKRILNFTNNITDCISNKKAHI